MDLKVDVQELEMKPSGEGLITYERRKKRKPVLDTSLVERVLDPTPSKYKGRDIGWAHGMVIDGNKSHWMCSWCGLIRYGGGVSRLKKHLAGVCHVRKCPNVPEEVAKSMLDNLLEKQQRRKKRVPSCSITVGTFPSHNDLVGADHKKSDLDNQPCSSMEITTGAMKKTKATTPEKLRNATTHPSKTTAQFFNDYLDKALKDGHAGVKNSVTNGQDCRSKIKHHWTNVLENMLQLIRMSEGGGIQNCIFQALAYGPYGFTREFSLSDTGDKAKGKGYWDRCSDDNIKGQHQHPHSSENAGLHPSNTGSCHQKEANMSTANCQKFFLDVICSEKFALLCELISENFQESKAKSLFDFSFINTKMKNGEYEHSPASFYQDMQQVWNKFQKLGQEMTFLANSLSCMSQIFFQMQVGKDLTTEADEHKPEETNQMGVAIKNSIDSYTSTEFVLAESDHSTKPDQIETSGLTKVYICKQCGTEANKERILACSGCDATYHFSCMEFNNKDITDGRWYCISCTTSNNDSSEPVLDNKASTLHQNCTVCDRLEISVTQNDRNENLDKVMVDTDLRNSSISSKEADEHLSLSWTAKSGLCKICGKSEEEDMKFLVCGHIHCPYKFYHIRCLKSSQIASSQQQNKRCWYCPSCLCRSCFCDKDDDKIILCDECDEAYHTYCMKPPRTSIPKGQWCCIPCNVARAKDGMKRYEQWILQKHSTKYSNEANSSMDLLISAAEKLKSEEQLIAGH